MGMQDGVEKNRCSFSLSVILGGMSVEICAGMYGRSDIVTEEDFVKIELFTVLMYDVTSQTETVNECRRVLYTQKNRSVENIPPSGEAFYTLLSWIQWTCKEYFDMNDYFPCISFFTFQVSHCP
ncbi:hypothetical protein JTB14_007733 [Gonioctena quinquepunctata]|nr:hypothetical protein JTB14_007733 [Gonioctena quinquepunctata]